MNDFLKKLNVLVKAGVNDRVSAVGDAVKRPHIGRMMDDNIQSLRQRINEAVEYEDMLQARIRQFEDEAARWDQQADEAVTQGNDVNARYAIEQMKRAEQRATIAQSDLSEHQAATQDLIQRVNVLEATAADASRAQAPTAEPAQPEQQAQPDDASTNIRLPDLGNVLRDTRDNMTALGESAAAQRETLSTDAQEHETAVDDDLERRRERLSKR